MDPREHVPDNVHHLIESTFECGVECGVHINPGCSPKSSQR